MANFIQQAQKLKRKIVLPEGEAIRILEAAVYCDEHGIADIVLLGDAKKIQHNLATLELSQGNIQIINQVGHHDLDEYSQVLLSLYKKSKLTVTEAISLCEEPLNFANLMVKMGRVDACVAGVNHTSGDVIRSALKIVGTAPSLHQASSKSTPRPSSIFIIKSSIFPEPVIFADCAMNISPSAKQLADIAFQSSQSIQTLLDTTAKIAMLSFSTNGSAYHRDVNKVRQATERLHQQHPELNVIGEIQFDAAISKNILKKKWPESDFEAPANVFIFPSLDAANIAYKIAEQMGGAIAIGPILQGLAKPVNDLSRGADVTSIVNTIAVTCLQAKSV